MSLPHASPPAARTLLVVDDTASVRFCHVSILEKAGYRCLTANNGAEAIALLQTQPIDLVVLDLAMPVMDGYTFTRQIRAEARFAHLPIVVLAFDIRDERLASLRDPQTFVTLAKPLKFPVLLAEIRRLLGVKASASTAA